MSKIKVLLADDQVLFVESLRTVLETRAEDFEVVGVAGSGREAIQLVMEKQPDIILMDVRMPEMDGVEATRIIHETYPDIHVLMLTTFDDDEYVVEALNHGAAGYMLKDIPPAELIVSLRAVFNGSVIISPQVANKLLRIREGEGKLDDGTETRPRPESSFLRYLSKRRLIGTGADNSLIARKLSIAEQTVKNHVSVIYSLAFGVPVAYALVFGRLRNSDNLFLWFLSTTLLPPVAVIVPVFLMFRLTGLLDTLGGMVLIYTGVNIPIVIWMTRSFLLDVPREILESCDIDGSSPLRSFFSIILPLSRQGVISTGLLVFVFVWNGFFFSINLTYVHAAPVTVYMGSFMTQQGLFWAKLCAISTLVVLPPMVLGWLAQRALVKGLTMGAVKG